MMNALEKLKEICGNRVSASPWTYDATKDAQRVLFPSGYSVCELGYCATIADGELIAVSCQALPNYPLLIELVEAQGDMLVCLTSGTEGETLEEFTDKMVNAHFKALSARAKLEEAMR